MKSMKAMIEQKWLGKTTTTCTVTVNETDVREYLKVIGETKDYQHDSACYLPATYPILFWQELDIPWLNQQYFMIHAEQTFQYEQYLQINVPYQIYIQLIRLKKIKNKQYASHRLYVMQDKTVVCSMDTLLIVMDPERR